MKRQEDKIYQIYVTDALKAIAENTSRFAGGQTLTSRYADLVDRKKRSDPEEEKTADEKANDIVNRIRNGLKKL